MSEAKASPQAELPDEGALELVGVLMVIGSLLFLAIAAAELLNSKPPTIGKVITGTIAMGLGIVLLFTGLYYRWAASSAIEAEVGEQGLSVTRESKAGAREWIRLEHIRQAKLTPWLMSPWLKNKRYYEIEIVADEGTVKIDDRFLVHLREPGTFVEKMQALLGDRFVAGQGVGA